MWIKIRQTGWWEFYRYVCWHTEHTVSLVGCVYFYIRRFVDRWYVKGVCVVKKHDWEEWERVQVDGDQIEYTGVYFYECERCGKEINDGDYVERMLF